MVKLAVICAALLVAGSMNTFAGGACCAAGGKAKSDKADKSYSACSKALKGIELTDEQQAKIGEIETACKAEGCSVEACAKSMDQIRAVLTDDQRAQFDARVEKMSDKSKKGCG